MSAIHFFLCAVPRSFWKQPSTVHGRTVDIARFVADALGCEQRIAKDVNLDNEYSRYTLCCQRLEQEIMLSQGVKFIARYADFSAVLQSGLFPAVALDSTYLRLLERTAEEPGPERLGASFFPPDTVGSHLDAFSRWLVIQGTTAEQSAQQRIAFFRSATQAGCGVVEFQSAFHQFREGELAAVNAADVAAQPVEKHERFISVPEFARDDIEIEGFGRRKQDLAVILRRQIREALTLGEPVTFGNEAQHDVIAEILNEFVFVPPGQSPQLLEMRVMYADGSEAEPFPLFCLPRNEMLDVSARATAPLRVALMSMRHLELDPEIDFCWFRNRDVSRTRMLAETDQFCFDMTLAQLRDSLALGDLVIHLYHTGFEPAVVGFYRGVVQLLREARMQHGGARLAVVPFYFRGNTCYQPGTVWQ